MSKVLITNSESMVTYMRASCDKFLQNMENKMIRQVTNMISVLRLEMYKEIDSSFQLNMQSDKCGDVNSASIEIQQNEGKSSVNSAVSTVIQSASDGKSEVLYDAQGEFIFPRRHSQKIKRREASRDPRPPVAGFSGTVPDVFIYSCSKDTSADKIKVHLEKQALKVKSVILKSHEDAAIRSFKVSVETSDDFDKLLSRKFTPRHVKVKKYIYYGRSGRTRVSLYNTGSRKLSCGDDPNLNVTPPLFVNDPNETVMSTSYVTKDCNEITDQVKLAAHLANSTKVTLL